MGSSLGEAVNMLGDAVEKALKFYLLIVILIAGIVFGGGGCLIMWLLFHYGIIKA